MIKAAHAPMCGFRQAAWLGACIALAMRRRHSRLRARASIPTAHMHLLRWAASFGSYRKQRARSQRSRGRAKHLAASDYSRSTGNGHTKVQRCHSHESDIGLLLAIHCFYLPRGRPNALWYATECGVYNNHPCVCHCSCVCTWRLLCELVDNTCTYRSDVNSATVSKHKHAAHCRCRTIIQNAS